DCAAYAANITSHGYNLFGSSPACYSFGLPGFTPLPTDKTGINPKFSFLIENGVHPLIPGSLAIDSANLNLCPLVDQRGIIRPQGSMCDIGAFEFATGGTVPAYILNYQGSPQSMWVSTPASVNFGVFVMDAEGKAVANATVTFTAPASGASGKFANDTISTTAQTDSNGIALASIFTANTITGNYFVTATVQGVAANTSFALSNIDVNINTYTLNQTMSPLPGQFLCGTNNLACTNGVNLDADKAHTFAYGTYNFYKNHHGRQSIDNANMDIISSVDYGSGYQNAYWSGTQMVYGDGYSLADDVVAHELTHGVTQYESNLFYYYQSGAINESFSDVWGELYDQENGLGNDTSSAKWLMGEDLPIGAIRSMSNPTAYSDPDKMTSPYYNTTSSDNGGVHTNSGINNKAVYLMVDGGTFNGKTVTALGANKTLAIYYEAQTNLLSSGADYGDLYNLLYQACLNLVNGPDGITNANCQEVRDATDAVEMNLQPISNFNTDAPLCNLSQTVVPIYQDGFENGLGNWTINNGSTPRWQLDSPYGPFAHSGVHFLYGNDYPQSGVVTDATVRLASKLIPAGSYLHFAHAYDFEFYGSNNYDGGVLEYST
ncbi:MAG: M4 family metallopeptidase, partial [Flavobacteriales bacterium]|nr:M4 family metallopeptidase [Flavobacteriales bacterium]